MKRGIRFFCVVSIGLIVLSGCTKQKDLVKSNERQRAIIASLTSEVDRLNQELDQLAVAHNDLAATKMDLESKLRAEMDSGDLEISMQDRGLVVTILNRILFDSGKAEVKKQAQQALGTIAQSVNGLDAGQMVYIEGHTDTDPIKRSNYKSNWELSTARALSVVHFLIDTHKVDPARLAACGYGEYHPIAPNTSAAGKSKNRRVEIIISPKKQRVSA